MIGQSGSNGENMRSAASSIAVLDRQARTREAVPARLDVRDFELAQMLIADRQRRGTDKYDEVWEGVYVMPPLANNPHQELVGLLTPIYHDVVYAEERGRVFPGANVSDRRSGWEENYRCPDIVVVLNDGRAIDCGTHWFGGPDFLTEVQSPGDETDDKIPFYESIQVQELLIIQRDTRRLRLLRHDGEHLREVKPKSFQGKKWLMSAVLPRAFRRILHRGKPRTEVCRTDDADGKWVV